jgi:hypothetical protein
VQPHTRGKKHGEAEPQNPHTGLSCMRVYTPVACSCDCNYLCFRLVGLFFRLSL